MKTTPQSKTKLWPALLLATGIVPLQAGSYTNDFSSGTAGLTIYNLGVNPGPEVRATGGNTGGYFKLADNVNGARGTVIFPDFEAGTAIESFDFRIDARVGAGTNPPADGFSINICRPNDAVLVAGSGFSSSPTGEADLPEEGTKTGLAIGFDTWFSGGADVVGFSVKLDDTTLVQVATGTRDPVDPADATSLETGPIAGGVDGLSWQPFRANLKSNGRLDVYWKGVKVVDDLVTGYTPSPGRIVFAGRTGGSNANFHFDNLSLTTAAVSKAAISSTRLTNTNYIIQVADLGTTSVFQPATSGPNAISVSIDGSPVPVAAGNVSKTGGVTTITLPIPAPVDPGSSHLVELSGKDQIGASITGTASVKAPLFPIVLNGPAGAPGSWGVREWYKGSGLTPALTNGQSALASVITQVAPLNPGDFGVIEAAAVPVINHSDPEGPGGKGNFNNDLPFIGDTAGTPDDNVVLIAKTQLVIPAAGTYTFAVHSDDGAGLNIRGGPSGNTSRFLSVSGTDVIIDPSDNQTAAFPNYTGDSNIHAVYQFTAAGTYDVQFISFEGGGGAFWELAWAPGTFTADRDTSTWTLVGNPSAPLPAFTPKFVTNLKTPPGTAGNFGIRTYLGATGTDNLGNVSNFLANTTRHPSDPDGLTVDALRPILNARDPDDGGGGVLGNDTAFPGNSGGGQDNVITTARGRIIVPATSTYTFWGQGDDGFLLRIKGVNGTPNPKFTRATQGGNDGAGRFEMSNPNELFFENGTGNADTRGIIDLPAGQYDLEYIHFEGGGGFWYELTAAVGSWPHGSNPATGWQAVGYDTPVTGPVALPGIAEPGWTVESSTPDRAEFNFSIAGAEAAINATLADVTAPAAKISTWDSLNFIDPEDGNNGSFTPNNNWPLNTAAGDNNYAMRATGTLNITVAGDYFLGFQGDDGGYMFINGPGNPVFSSIVSTNHPAEATIGEEIPGSGVNNAIRVQVGTGNSRTIVRTTLAVGSYTLKTLMYEGGGGSWWEVLGSAAAGDFFNIPLLVKGPGGTALDTEGLLLAAQPQPDLTITGFTANTATGEYTLNFGSIFGHNYRVEYTTGFQAEGVPASPLKWNVVPLLSSFPGYGITTSATGNVTDLLTGAGGQLPDLSKVFFRIRNLNP